MDFLVVRCRSQITATGARVLALVQIHVLHAICEVSAGPSIWIQLSSAVARVTSKNWWLEESCLARLRAFCHSLRQWKDINHGTAQNRGVAQDD